ncbi:hypothetical protein [Bathymodiolus septemdierum thioautotrophic gill symbiont]|uniref:Uncharacterized protein n=1 Tax=endosymbiont of Bathymodiolus septemdierum str. Myojin knoll TaxID=1303921 RepID=A0A0P0URW4_9GAMM|nr:hypothetical protein [Bathymodiolus septemdierum thioautotrophic gill symbiont]BAS67555.1 conserved hypothetical protein [endosymbiont of Bathymodiolus septemdierum str. Myojin knoll]
MGNNKEKEKYKLTGPEKLYLALAVFYSVITIYLLNTPIGEWIFNLGQYNTQLLEVFPKAQYWVNVSVAYREKMILLYVLYQGIFWFVFITTIGIFIKDWAWYKQNAIHYTHKRVRKKYLMVFYIFFTGIFLIGTIFSNASEGSKFYMLYDQLDKVGRNNDIFQWNSIYGFIFNRLVLGSLIYLMTFYFIVSILATKTLFTNNSNKGE